MREDEKLMALAMDPQARHKELARCRRRRRKQSFHVLAAGTLFLVVACLTLASSHSTALPQNSALNCFAFIVIVFSYGLQLSEYQQLTSRIQFLMLAEKLTEYEEAFDSNEHAAP